MAGRDLSEELFGPVGGRDLSEELFGPAPAPPPPPEGGFIPAVQRGFLQTGILLGDILPAMAARAVGADEYAERQFKEAAETEKKIQEKYAPAIASYKDVKGIGDAITYAVESVGELVPSILPSLFTGGLAGVLGRGAVIAAKEAAETAARKQIAEKGVQALTEKEVMDQIRKAGIDAASRTAMKYQALGAVGGSSLQNIPEVYKNIKDETEEESLGSAMLFGGLNSLLDAALPLSLLAKARKAGIPGEEIVGAWYKRFGVGAAKGFATEGATEAAQEMSSAAAEKFVDNNIDFFSEKNLERFINAGLKGGLGGGVVSGATDVMLGKKSLTEENKPLDQDIRDAQTDILARRALLDELRAQAAEEGRNKLDADSLKDLGFGTKYSLYDSLLNKDINDPAQAAEVVNILQTAVQDPATKGRERVVAANTLEVINQYLETRGEPDVGQVVEEPSGAGISVPTEPVAPAPAEGVAGVERTGVVPPVADVGAPVGGEGLAAAPVAPVETAPVVAPEVTAPEIAAPEVAAPSPEAQPAPEPVVPTTRELITEQETQLAKDMERFQNLLQQQVRRFGLNDVAVQIDTDLKKADAQYTKGLIKLAVDAADPVRALRHESIHAMKELGFFTPSQWNALVNRANESWINTYLQNRNVDGGFIEPGQTSRYDAYLKLFKDQGLNEAQAQEALIEEAISDAFGDFSQTQAPPGMMRAILNRMKNFFKAIKETVSGSGVTDPERLFGKIEKGEVAAPLKPVSEVAAPPEQKTEAPKAEAPAKATLRTPPPEQEVVNQVTQDVAKYLPISQQMADSTSLGLQTGKSGKEQFVKNYVGGIPEIIAYLEGRRRSSGLPVLNIAKEKDRIILSDLMTAEALASINAGGAALEWYDETIAKTIGMASLKYPDLATDLDQQMAFKLATAIASQGMNVEDNLTFAMKQFDYFRRNGRFEEIGTGTDAKAMRTNYILANKMFDKYELEGTRRFLATPFKVEELRSAGFDIGGELGDETVLGSSIFGPKIGFGFYSNLNGNFEPVTMDMWFMRLIGRLTGNLRLLDRDLLKSQLERFRKSFAETGDNGVYADEFKPDILERASKDEKAAVELARVVNSVFNSDFKTSRDLYDEGVRVKTEFVSAAQRILNSVDFPKDAPQNGTERRQLRDVVNRTVKQIESILGRRIPPASLQALVWYPEQELYASLGAKLRVTSQDYAGAMRQILRGENYGAAELDRAAEDGARQVRAMAVKPTREEVGRVGAKPGVAYAPEEREAFLEARRVEKVVEEERAKPRRAKVVFEVAPDPNNEQVVTAWRDLPAKQRLEISDRVTRAILPRAVEMAGGRGRVASQVGSYLDDTNPSFALYMDKGDPVEMSKYLGFILGQDSMMVISPRPAPGLEKVGAVVVDINTQDPAKVNEIYQRLHNIRVGEEQPIQGQSTINGKMVVLNYSNLSTEDLARAIAGELAGAYDVSITEVYSAFPEKDAYDYSDPKTDPRGKKGDIRLAARALRREATDLLAKEIGITAEARAEEVTPPKYSISGKRITDTPELREAARQSAIVDAQGSLIPMYHGTGALIRIFRPKQAGATFVSPDPGFASGFTSASRRWMVRHIGQFLKPEEIRKGIQELRQTIYSEYGKQSKMTSKIMDEIHDVLLDAKETGVYNFKGELEDKWYDIAFNMIPGAKERVMELYVLAKKPFDFENKADVNKIIKQLMTDPAIKAMYGYDAMPGVDILKPENFMLRQTLERSDKDYKAAVEAKFKDNLSRGSWTAIETPEVQKAIKALDFDSFYVVEGGVKNLGVYDPKLIKSADENVGPFGQRPPTEEEAARVGLEPSEALKAQEEGDIRFSLRAHKNLFDRADEIPMSEGVEAIRDDWVGGVAGVGNRDSMYELFRIEGGPAYTGEVQKFLRNNLGENFKGYRLMSQGEFEELTTGSMGSQFVSFSLNPDVAKGFKNLPAYANRKDLVVVEMDLTPEHVHMVGHPGEQELVVDYGQGYNPAEIKVIEGDVERKSLRSKPFDPDSLPTNNKEYTLPQNTILYHGAYETIADAIQSVGYLTSRPKIKAHGGLMNEGGLIWFGSKEAAQKYANSEADRKKVEFDREAGIIREPGKVFEAITDQPYKLISRYKVLSAKEANALNEALGLPDYKRLKAGDSADTAAYRAGVDSNSNAERFEIESGKYTIQISAPWPIILKTLNADGFYSDGTVALTAENGIRLSEEGKPMERFSLRSQIDPAINARIVQTTTAREEKSFPQRITQAIGPESWSRFRAAALNRYNRLGEYDKMRLKQMGGADLLADSNAESAALMSDLSAGIVAGSLGVYDKVGGVPVYNHHYVVERTVQTPTGPRTIVVGGKISNRNTAEALARRYPNSKVKERGYTAVSNLNNTIKGPIAIFAPLAKLGDPYAYQAYQYWAGVKRGSKWVTNPNGQVVEQLFNDPTDISKAEELRKKFLNDYQIDFNQIQKEWIDYNDQLVQYMLDTGVISRENAKKFKDHGDYIPFYRQINGDDDAVGPRVFQSIAAVKAPRKIKGGEDPLGDFLENVVRNTQAAVQAGLKNVAARRAADVGMDLGFVSRVSQAQADPVNSFYVMENGQKVFYDSSDPLLIDSIKSLGLSEFPGIGLLAGPAGVLRNLVTKDPGFMLANMMRDSLAAWTTSGVNMLPVAATLKNFTEALAGTSPEFKALLMSGVVGGYDYSQGTVDAAKQFGKELRKTAGARTIGEKAMAPFTSLWEGLEKGTQASDAATRIEVYKQTLRETGNEAEAMFRALEVMNFNRKGNNPIVRVATAAIPFLNARMQGLDVLYRAGLGKNATANAQEIQKAFWRRGMYMAALSTMYWALTHDDDEYKKQEQETKDNNWLFPSAGVRVPIPFEVGVLFKVIPERIAALVFGDDSAKDFTASMVRNLTSTLAVNPIPQTLLPLVEATANFSFFTFRPIVGQGLEGVAAPYQIGPSTSRAGQLLAEMTKGLPSALQISPMKADAIIQGYTGTIGSYMSQLFDAVYDMHTDNPKVSLRFEQLPVVKRFILDPDARGQVTAYFDLKNSVDEATRTANLLERSMNYKEWGEYYSQNIGLFAVKDYILDMDKTLKEYRDLKNMVRSTPMDADQKRDSILAITRIENQLNANIQILKKQAGK